MKNSEQTPLNFFRALALAYELGPDYRVALAGTDYSLPEFRCYYDSSNGFVQDDGSKSEDIGLGAKPAVIICKSQRVFKGGEVVRWASLNPDKTFRLVFSGILYKWVDDTIVQSLDGIYFQRCTQFNFAANYISDEEWIEVHPKVILCEE